MEKRNARLKHILFSFLFGLFLLPWFVQLAGWPEVKPLSGEELKTDTLVFSDSAWFAGKFQLAAEENFGRWLGVRPLVVRVGNEIVYRLFGQSTTSVVLGRQNELFELIYVNAWLGKDRISNDKISENTQALKKIQDLLEKRGKHFLYILTPNKARFYAEKLPEYYQLSRKSVQNYPEILQAFSEQGINLLDFNAWFLQMKDTASFRLFPRNGSHWTEAAALYAMDSVVKVMEEMNGMEIRNFYSDGLIFSDSARGPEDELWKLMNILSDIPQDSIPYPVLRFEEDTFRRKPKVLTISDSFWWVIYGMYIPHEIFSHDSQFWFYNREIFMPADNRPRQPEEFDLRKEIESCDFVLMLVNESNLRNFTLKFDARMRAAFPELN